MKLNDLVTQMDIINYNKDMENMESYTFRSECGLMDDILELETMVYNETIEGGIDYD